MLRQMRQSLRSAARLALVEAVAGCLALAGLGFLIAALFLALADRLGTIAAAASVGVGLVALAGVILALARRSAQRSKQLPALDEAFQAGFVAGRNVAETFRAGR